MLPSLSCLLLLPCLQAMETMEPKETGELTFSLENCMFALVIGDVCPQVAGLYESEAAAQAAYSEPNHGIGGQVFCVPVNLLSRFMEHRDMYLASVYARPCSADGQLLSPVWMSRIEWDTHMSNCWDAKKEEKHTAAQNAAFREEARIACEQAAAQRCLCTIQ